MFFRTLFFTLSFFICTAAWAQQVPVVLPSQAAIDAYLNFLQSSNHSAFALSRGGAFGSSWSFGSQEEAKFAAKKYCKHELPEYACEIVAVDGESLGNVTDSATLRVTLRSAQKKEWPLPKSGFVPLELKTHHQAAKDYFRYVSLLGYKAFAIANDGVWASSVENSNSDVAEAAALKQCRLQSSEKNSCMLVDLNNQALAGFVAYESAPKVSTLDRNLLPVSVKSYDQWRMYKRYLDVGGHRAYAIAYGTHAGFLGNQTTLELARRGALINCEKRLVGKCHLAAENGVILVASIQDKQLLVAPEAQPIHADKKIRALFGEQWVEYQQADGHKAFSVSKFGAAALSQSYLSEEYAASESLRHCENQNDERRQNPKLAKRIAPCHVLALNNRIIQGAVPKILSSNQ